MLPELFLMSRGGWRAQGARRGRDGVLTVSLHRWKYLQNSLKFSALKLLDSLKIYLLLLFSCSIGSNALRPRGLQHSRFPCPSPSPRVCSNSWPLGCWCIISSNVEVDFLFLRETYRLKNYAQPKSWELCFIQWEILGLQVQETALQLTLR